MEEAGMKKILYNINMIFMFVLSGYHIAKARYLFKYKLHHADEYLALSILFFILGLYYLGELKNKCSSNNN
jgi:formate/nitrite transporter FocA (FNT family)